MLDVRSDLYWFRGHFPGNPILPGVVQVDWAMHFGAELGYVPQEFAGLARVKFKSIVRPPARLHLELTSRSSGLGFTFTSGETLHSAGTIRFNR